MARILYIGGIESYVPSLAANSIQVMRMAGAWAALGHEVTLAVPHGTRHLAAHSAPDPFDFYGIEHRFTIRRLRVSGAGRRAALAFFGMGARRLAQSEQWDLVYCRNAFASILLARGGMRHAFEAHHFRLAGRVDHWHLPILRSPLVERLVLIGSSLTAPFIAAGIEPAKLLVAPDGAELPAAGAADVMQRTAARQRLCELAGCGADQPIALYAGSLGSLKGTQLLIETARMVPEVQFLLLGGPEAATVSQYRRIAAETPNLQVAGTIVPAMVPSLLAAADVLLLPHTRASEGRYVSPLKTFEYLAAGRPIVAADLATTRDILEDGVTALLTEPDSAEALATAIRRLLGDARLAERLAAGGREAAGAHTWQARATAILSACPRPHPVRRRVLHVINSFHPLVGGAERQAAALARQQLANGDAVTVLTRRPKGMASIDGHGPLGVRRVGCWWLRGPGFLAAAFTWLLPRRKQFDIIHAHQAHWPAVIAALLRSCGGPPAVVKLAGPDLPRGTGPLTRLRRFALSRLDAVVATQPAMAAAAKEIGLERVMLVPNGVDAAHFAPDPERDLTRAAHRISPGDQVVLYVGRLERVKGIDLLIAAWPEVIRTCPRARLRIAGEGSLGQALRRSLPTGVELLGRTDDPRSLYQTADLLVLPSRYEGLSNALLEAMATRLAVVATAVGGNAEVIHDGADGVLVPAGDPTALASAILALTEDPERRRVLGDAARETVLRRYRLEAVEELWEELYAQLGSKGPPSRVS